MKRRLPFIVPQATMERTMTFNDFRVTRRYVSDIGQALGITIYDDGESPGYVYLDRYYIEKRNPNWPVQNGGEFYLAIGNWDCLSDDLNVLERRLYDFARNEERWT